MSETMLHDTSPAVNHMDMETGGGADYAVTSGSALLMSLSALLAANNISGNPEQTLVVSYEMLEQKSGALVRVGDSLYYQSDFNFSGLQSVHYSISNQDGVLLLHDTLEISVSPSMAHHGDEVKAPEHMAALTLVNPSDATHIAVKDGNWSDMGIWQNVQTGEMEVPGAEARVFIPKSVSVTYDMNSDVPLFTVRVDGKLSFDTEHDTTMVVDTLFCAPSSVLNIGTEDHPVHADVTTQIVIRSDGDPVTVRDWDMGQLSKGIVTHGQVRIYGEDKTDFITLQQDAQAGDDRLVLSGSPQGWSVGDMLVLGGTSYDANGSDADNTRFHDEVLEITKIEGNVVHFRNHTNAAVDGQNVLAFDHTRPQGTTFDSSELNLYVSNLSRNIVVRGEGGSDTPTEDRGHVMFMHNPDVQVHNAAFIDLGRTDKEELINGVSGLQPDGSVSDGSNVRGRYPVHFHRTGAEDISGTPAEAEGNVVWGSPGWGLVHHQSYLVAENNVVFDVVGAGISAEAGDEIGVWRNNIVIKTTGDSDPLMDLSNSDRAALGDFGFNGEAYWVQGGMQVEFHDNIAISSMVGVNLFAGTDGGKREASSIAVKNLNIRLDDGTIVETDIYKAFKNAGYADDDRIDVSNLPVKAFDGFEAYNVDQGVITWNMQRNDDGVAEFSMPAQDQAHSEWSILNDITLWNVFGSGVFLEYTTQTELQNILIIGNPENPVDFLSGINGDGRGVGVDMNKSTQNLIFENIRIEGFDRGMHIPEEGGFINSEIQSYDETSSISASKLINGEFANNNYNFTEIQAFNHGTHMFPNYFEIIDTIFHSENNSGNLSPVADFDNFMVGDRGVVFFDASASFDWDTPDALRLSQGGIAAYGWDFNGDNIIDNFGRYSSHGFDQSGLYSVGLTVWDAQGMSNTVYKNIEVNTDEAYDNMFKDNANYLGKNGYSLGVIKGGDGWVFGDSFNINNELTGYRDGIISLDGETGWSSGFGQVWHDNGLRQGGLNFQFDMDYANGVGSPPDEITIRIYGINGQYDMSVNGSVPHGIDAINSPVITEILDIKLTAPTDGWKTFQYDVDFGKGYNYIVMSASTNLGMNSASDTLKFDNFYLADGVRPEAMDDFIEITGWNNSIFNILYNDVSISGDKLHIEKLENAEFGNLILNQDGTITYTPQLGFSGLDKFSYIISDEHGNTDLGMVNLKIDTINADNLIIHYNFDQDKGNTAEDMGADYYDTDGVFFGNAEHIQNGVFKNAVYFDNRNENDVYLENDPASFVFLDNDEITYGTGNDRVFGATANTYSQKSLSFWFKIDESKAEPQVIADFGTDGNGLSVYLDGTKLIAGGEAQDWSYWISADLSLGQWHHVTLSLNGSNQISNGQGANSLNVWLDGKLMSDVVEKDGVIGEIAGSGSFNDDALGASYFGFAYAGDGLTVFPRQNGMIGALDDFRMYDRVLSGSEAQTLFSYIQAPVTNNGNEAYHTGIGNDLILGGIGNDLYLYRAGEDIFDDISGTDTLKLPENVTQTGLSFMRDMSAPNDLVVHVTDQDGHYLGDVTLKDQFVKGRGVEKILLADDQALDLTKIQITTTGTNGADSIVGVSFGGSVNDIIYTYAGKDTVRGGKGNDYIDGGADQDYLYGDDGSDTLLGGAGNDVLQGGNGDDLLYGGDGYDVLYGNNGIDWVEGGGGNDRLFGGTEADLLFGQDGNDILNGGVGADFLDGGLGTDTFAFTKDGFNTGVDIISGFSRAQGDKIDISDLLSGYDPLHDLLTDFVRITQYGSDSYLAVDMNGGANSFTYVAMITGVTGITDEDALAKAGTLVV